MCDFVSRCVHCVICVRVCSLWDLCQGVFIVEFCGKVCTFQYVHINQSEFVFRNVHLKPYKLSTYQVIWKKIRHTDTMQTHSNFTGIIWAQMLLWVVNKFFSVLCFIDLLLKSEQKYFLVEGMWNNVG